MVAHWLVFGIASRVASFQFLLQKQMCSKLRKTCNMNPPPPPVTASHITFSLLVQVFECGNADICMQAFDKFVKVDR
jgi:hypothetical protein